MVIHITGNVRLGGGWVITNGVLWVKTKKTRKKIA